MTAERQFVHDMNNLLGIIVGYTNLMLDEMPSDDPKRLDLAEIRKAGENAVVVLKEWHAQGSKPSGPRSAG